MGFERVAAVLQKATGNYDTDLLPPHDRRRRGPGRAGATRAASSDDGRRLPRHRRPRRAPSPFLIADGRAAVERGPRLRAAPPAAPRRAPGPHARASTSRSSARSPTASATCWARATPRSRSSARASTTRDGARRSASARRSRRASALLEDEVAKLKRSGVATLPGEVAFKLYDTYGFPLDLTRTSCAARSWRSTRPASTRRWTRSARGRAKAPRFVTATAGSFAEIRSRFAGDRVGDVESRGASRSPPTARSAARRARGDEVEIVTAETPFYGESGGQVGRRAAPSSLPGGGADRGHRHAEAAPRPDRARRPRGARRRRGRRPGAPRDRRAASRGDPPQPLGDAPAARGAAHQLGEHVRQAGSLVDARAAALRLHAGPAPLRGALAALEDEVNEHIRAEPRGLGRRDVASTTRSRPARSRSSATSTATACACCAWATTRSSCAAARTSRAPATSASSSCAASRRSAPACAASRRSPARARSTRCAGASASSSRSPSCCTAARTRPPAKIEKLLAAAEGARAPARRERRRRSAAARVARPARRRARDRRHQGARAAGRQVDAKALRELADKLRDRMQSGVVVLGGSDGERVMLLAAVTKDLVKRVNAGNLIKEIAPHRRRRRRRPAGLRAGGRQGSVAVAAGARARLRADRRMSDATPDAHVPRPRWKASGVARRDPDPSHLTGSSASRTRT